SRILDRSRRSGKDDVRYSKSLATAVDTVIAVRSRYCGLATVGIWPLQRFNSMSSSSSNIFTGDYIRFVNDQCQFWHSEEAAKELLYERGFIMRDVEEKAPTFYSLLQDIVWGLLVKEPCK
ncbi:hypothetical protein HAX54_019458, partial [Datura stramonium]|nr:hypothetical protein [Datura stramonium]